MAGNANQKIKLLTLINILEEKTDEENPLTATQLCEELSKFGIYCERKAIYSDINTLFNFGLDIVSTRSPKPGYFLGERKFELAEVRLLLDAVQSAAFITPRKTKILTEKLCSLTSIYNSKKIKEQVFIDSRIKNSNEEIYYNIDVINKAISKCRKIVFTYYRKDSSRNPAAKKGDLPNTVRREHVISPYALIWSNDHYYLIGNYDKYDDLSHYRIDRMKKALLLDTVARPFSEVSEYKNHFDAADYCKKALNMFGGEPDAVELIFEEALYEVITDQFGTGGIRPAGEGKYRIRFHAMAGTGLINWITQFGEQILVVKPEGMRDKIVSKIKAMSEMYGID